MNEVGNPYRQMSGVGNIKLAESITALCHQKGNGTMFLLFDIGNLSLSKEKLYVYRNSIGDAIRFFCAKLTNGNGFDGAFVELRSDINEIAILSCDGKDKLNIFMKKVDEVLAGISDSAAVSKSNEG